MDYVAQTFLEKESTENPRLFATWELVGRS
jgi:hypothetical protein